MIEAAGTERAWVDATALVRPGGTVVMFGGLPRDARPPVDAYRLHYEELTVRGSFHHTPATVRAALGFLASGAYPWERLVSHRVLLAELPALFADPPPRAAQGGCSPLRTLRTRELNRTLLMRQFLLERTRRPLLDVIARLVALQAQYAPSPYVALWSRRAGFRKAQLTDALRDGSAIKSGVLRGTLHVVTRDLYPFVESAHIESQRGRVAGLGVDPAALFASWPDEPVEDAAALAGRLLGTDDRWTISFALRALPWVRPEPVGDWPHTKPSPVLPWRAPLAPPEDGAERAVRDYLAGYGPAAREDIEQFTSFKVRQIAPVLHGLRTYEDDQGRVLFDLPRARLAPGGVPAPVRFLPPFDSIILAHRDRSRILPCEYLDVVLRRKNATTLATFTVDGLIAGSWKAERLRGRWRVAAEPFAPLPAAARRDVEAERDALERFYNG